MVTSALEPARLRLRTGRRWRGCTVTTTCSGSATAGATTSASTFASTFSKRSDHSHAYHATSRTRYQIKFEQRTSATASTMDWAFTSTTDDETGVGSTEGSQFRTKRTYGFELTTTSTTSITTKATTKTTALKTRTTVDHHATDACDERTSCDSSSTTSTRTCLATITR